MKLAKYRFVALQHKKKRLGFQHLRPHMTRMQSPSTLERAFALARSGTCSSLDEIRRTLKRERYDQVEAHLAGSSIGKQLRALCEEARRSQPTEQAC